MDMLEKLRVLASLKTGDPMPQFLGDGFNWHEPIGKLCAQAADEIERLRSLCGCADVGPSFRVMTADAKRAFDSVTEKTKNTAPGDFVELTDEELAALRGNG
jgi:hypothetical protein